MAGFDTLLFGNEFKTFCSGIVILNFSTFCDVNIVPDNVKCYFYVP